MQVFFNLRGRDTTAQALSWTIYNLCKSPENLQKLQQEIKETLGDAIEPTYSQVKTMKYANAVFQEALRLHPSVPKNIKTCLQDDVLPSGTQIKAGTRIVWLPWVLTLRR